MPTAREVPPVDVLITEDAPSPLNPLGVKGAGEGGINAVGAAIAAAIDDAIGVPGAVDHAAGHAAADEGIAAAEALRPLQSFGVCQTASFSQNAGNPPRRDLSDLLMLTERNRMDRRAMRTRGSMRALDTRFVHGRNGQKSVSSSELYELYY